MRSVMMQFLNIRYMKKCAVVLLCIAFLAALCSCGSNMNGTAVSSKAQTITVEESLESVLIEDEQETYYLFITTDGMNFNRYPYEGEEVYPEKLIDAIAAKTGWDLTLADTVTDGKGGMTVSFAKSCSIFSEHTDGQSEEFKVDDQKEMTAAVLGSVQKTLQYYAAPKDPDKVDIYFSGENDEPLKIEGILELPLEQPYAYEYWH